MATTTEKLALKVIGSVDALNDAVAKASAVGISLALSIDISNVISIVTMESRQDFLADSKEAEADADAVGD
ncbi:MAG: hypothetical protein COA47_10355 [Robiginitomaculum sp.]|nr:MAG: hypothetical protein COA47_10355 [Robiginitomaculum sp.]